MRLLHRTFETGVDHKALSQFTRKAVRAIVLRGEDILLLYTQRYQDYSLPGGGGSLGFVAAVLFLASLGPLLFDLVSSRRCKGIGTTRKGEMKSRVYHHSLSVISSASDSWASSYFSP